MLNWIKKLLGFECEIDSKLFRKSLHQYPYGAADCSGAYLANITEVLVTKKGKLVTCHIRTHRPGILIGKHGDQIAGIKELMELKAISQCEHLIIDIQKETMFQGLYD